MSLDADSTKKLYEVGYLLIPLIAEDKIADEVNTLRSYIENDGGFIVLEEQPKMRKLAYEIKQRGIASKKSRFGDGYFGWIRFQAMPVEIEPMQESFDKNDKILRFMFIKPIKDSPRAVRSQSVLKPTLDGIKKENREKKETMTEEDLDKEIDMLLDTDKVAA